MTPAPTIPYIDLFKQVGEETNIPWELLAAICKEESAFNPDSVSSAGAIGLMQVTLPAAQTVGYTEVPTDPATNILCGAKFMRWLLDYLNPPVIYQFTQALVSYVWGVGNYQRHPNPKDWPDEVLAYVIRVLNDEITYTEGSLSGQYGAK